MRKGFVYLIASKKNGTLYLGVTSDLARRVFEYKTNYDAKSFTARYDVHTLVWFEEYDLIVDAIQREKSIKKYKRQWKINLIEEANPDWREMCPETGMFLLE